MPKIVLLWTDAAMWLLLVAVLFYAWVVRRDPDLTKTWRKVFHDPAALSSTVILAFCLIVTVLDSVHFRSALPPPPGLPNAPVAYDTRTRSVLDVTLKRLTDSRESTYSQPLAYVGFVKESSTINGKIERIAPRLAYGGAHLTDPERQWAGDVTMRALQGMAAGLVGALLLSALLVAGIARSEKAGWAATAGRIWRKETVTPWRVAVFTMVVLGLLIGATASLMMAYHVLGTDRTGNDVLYQALKSIRTAFVIGSLATVATLPLAVVLGVMSGYMRGWVDELIQYIYTVLSSVPNVLLIAACVLMVQVYLDKHAELYETGVERADLKLFLLCIVLGATSWPGLCRLLRADTMKLRELEYVQAATAFGVSRWRIMARHIFPNVAHLMLINTVLDFSALILYEAVLSYVGIGVDPSMNSFGQMINLSRSEMIRDPIVWWSFAAAFVFMVGLVLSINLFADGVRDAFDPRSRVFKPRLLHLKKKPA